MAALGPGTLQVTKLNCTDYSGNYANYTLGINLTLSVRPGATPEAPSGGGTTYNYYNNTDNAPKSLPTGFFNGVLVQPIYGLWWLNPLTIMCAIAGVWFLKKSRKKVKVF